MAQNDGSISVLLELVDKATPELTKFVNNYGKAVDDINKSTTEMASTTGSAMDSMAAAFGKLAGPIAAAVAAVGSLGAVFEVAFKYAERVDELADMGTKFGYTASQVAILDRAVKDANGSLEAVQSMQGKVATSMSKTGDETGKAAEAYDRLGIKTTDAAGNLRTYSEVTVDVAKKVQEGNLSAQDYADIIVVGGKAAMESSISVLAAAEAQKQVNEMYEAGIGITEEAVKAAGDYESVTAKLSYIFDVMGSQLMQIIIPTFTELKQALIDSYVNGGLVAQAFDIIKGAAVVLTTVIQALSIIFVGLDLSVNIVIKTITALGNSLDILFNTPLGQKGAAFKVEWAKYWTDVVKVAEDANARIMKLQVVGTAQGTVAKPTGGKGNTNPSAPPIVTGGSSSKAQVAEWERYLKNLKAEADQLGMNTRQKMQYKIETIAGEMANKKAAESFRQKASALADQIYAFEQAKKASDEARKADEAWAKQIKDAMVSLQDDIAQLEFENTLLGKNNEEREIAIRTRQLEKLGIDATTEGMTALLDKYKEELDIKKRNTEITSILGNTESAKLEEQRRKLIMITDEYKKGAEGRIKTEQEYLEAVEVVLGKQKESADSVSEFWLNAAKSMQNAMSTFFFDIMQGNMSDLAGNFKKMIDKMVADYMASQLSQLLFGDIKSGSKSSSGGGLVQAAFGALSGMFKAGGGGVTGGDPYIVGEIGPELFVPRSSGTIIPADVTSSLMGGGANNLTVNVTAMDSQDVLRSLDKIKRPLAEMLNGTNRSYNLGGR